MRFGAILALVQGWWAKVENMHFCQLSWNWVFKVDLDTHLTDKHGHLFLWDLHIFRISFKVGQIKVENMNFSRLSKNLNFKVDLDTHLRDNHGHLFWLDLKLVWPLFKVGQTKVENMHFCQLFS